MKKIIISLSMIAAVAAVAVGATTAFFSDTETSTGNTFTAGAIDLGVDNQSYYNGVHNGGTSWGVDYDIDGGTDQEEGTVRQFFKFTDLKPGDYGEDTISLRVLDNESWMCSDVTLTSNDDVDCTEPETDEEGVNCQIDQPSPNADGDLAQNIDFLWWADDGDNVLEDNEDPLFPAGTLGDLGVGNTATVDLADDDNYIWSSLQGPLGGLLTDNGGEKVYIGKAWCFGDISPFPLLQSSNGSRATTTPAQDGSNNGVNGEPVDGGFLCSGASSLNNAAQTDSATMDISFRAVQARNNPGFECNVLP